DIFSDLVQLFVFPEWKVKLPVGKAASQNDIYVIGKYKDKLMTIMVEGKVNEPFDKTISEWLHDSSSGKKERLEFLLSLLCINNANIDRIRYQLLHRAASAVIEADRINASNATLLIHSFSEKYEWYDDFASFVDLFGLVAAKDSVVGPARIGAIDL